MNNNRTQVNPFDVYNKLGINVAQNNSSFMPATINDFQKGLDNNLNFGNKQLAEVYNNPLYERNAFLQGVQNNKNYGNPFLLQMENQKGFFPPVQNDKNIVPVSNVQPHEAQIQNTPASQNTFMQNLKENPFATVGKALSSPIGRGLLVSGLGLATGGGAMNSLGYGLNTIAQNNQNINQDATNRAFLGQQGLNTSKYKGYLTDNRAKNISDNVYKQNYNKYRMQLLKLREDIANSENDSQRLKMTWEAHNKGQLSNQDATNLLGKYGFDGASLQSSNDTNYSKVRTENTKADTALKNTKTQYIPKEFALKQKEINSRIQANNKRLNLLQQKINQGISSIADKQEYQKLRNTNMQLIIEQNKLINNIYQTPKGKEAIKNNPVVKNNPTDWSR